MLTNEDIEWIRARMTDDPATLRLRYGSSDSVMTKRILQIECRRKAASKLPDTLQCELFEFPSALLAEQSTSDRIASFHASVAGPQKSVVDLTAGLGIDAFHFARTSDSVLAVEINFESAEILRFNASALGLDNIRVVCADCTELLPTLGKNSLLFIDPARRGSSGERVYSITDCTPDIIPLLPEFARHAPRMLVKLSPMLDMSAIEKDLAPYVNAVYAVGTRTECKEILVDMQFSHPAEEPLRLAVTLCPDGTQYDMAFTRKEEAVADFLTGIPENGLWLVEPWPSVMKAAPWNLLCSRFGLRSLASNSHLYISSVSESNVGNCFKILEVIPYSSGNIKRLSRRYPAAGITVRNFPVSAQGLRTKLKIKDADYPRLFATTLESGEKVIIMTEAAKQKD